MLYITYIPPKKGLRVLGVAESFCKSNNIDKSVLAGVVMRGDGQIDGFGFEFCTIGGLDASESIYRLYRRINRKDIRVLVLSGVVISLYNIIDLKWLYEKIGIPIISVTYEDSPGLEKFLSELPFSEKRLEIYRKNGQRIPVRLKNNYIVYIRTIGVTIANAVEILNLFVIHGRYIEPIRVARILARNLYRFLFNPCNR